MTQDIYRRHNNKMWLLNNEPKHLYNNRQIEIDKCTTALCIKNSICIKREFNSSCDPGLQGHHDGDRLKNTFVTLREVGQNINFLIKMASILPCLSSFTFNKNFHIEYELMMSLTIISLQPRCIKGSGAIEIINITH